MPSFQLTYLLCTRNKLTYLRHALARLLANLQDGDEVVIIDGASTDGTAEYLGELHAAGKIHQFVSEPDKCEAHAANKGLLLARGEVIKFVSDDDVFHYPTIQHCKRYMLANSAVDILGTDGAAAWWGMSEPGQIGSVIRDFEKWAREGQPFAFYGLGMMLRRQSLALLGLFNTGFVAIDEEYGRRASTQPVCIAWCSHLSFVHFVNPHSIGFVRLQQVGEEVRRLMKFYQCEPPPPALWRRLTSPLRRVLRPIKNRLVGARPGYLSSAPVTDEAMAQTAERFTAWLEARNQSLPSFQMARRGPVSKKT